MFCARIIDDKCKRVRLAPRVSSAVKICTEWLSVVVVKSTLKICARMFVYSVQARKRAGVKLTMIMGILLN